MEPLTERIALFPWEALPYVSRDEIVARRQATDHFPTFADVGGVAKALSDLLGARCDVAPLTLGLGPLPPLPNGVALVLRDASDAAEPVYLELDLSLVLVMVAQVTHSQAPSLVHSEAEATPRLCGAACAIATAVGRRVAAMGSSSPFVAETASTSTSLAELLSGVADPIHAAYSVIVGDEAHLARVWLRSPRPFARGSFPSFGRAPLALAVVLTEVSLLPSELAALAPADVCVVTKVPANGISIPVTLAASRSDCGIRCDLDRDRGVLTYVGEIVDLTPSARVQEGSMPNERVLEDVPVAVRVEIGNVELTAREWARLRAGDTLTLGRRIGEPVVLRVSGVEVARGELVNVEGEVGVRILEKHPSGSDTVDTQVVPT